MHINDFLFIYLIANQNIRKIGRSLISFNHRICDYNHVFFRKRKLKPYKIFMIYLEYWKAFMFKFGNSESNENIAKQQKLLWYIQRFICNVGGIIGEAFVRKKLRNCKSELLKIFLRTTYICTVRNNAHMKYLTIYHQIIIVGYWKIPNIILNGLKEISY